MSLSEKTLTELHQLVAQNTDLLKRVQATNDAAQAAALIAQAATENGINVSEAELAAHFEQASAAAKDQALSDQQLEAVAGGINDDGRMALISVFTLGLGCALVSIGQALGGKHIDGTAKYLDKQFC